MSEDKTNTTKDLVCIAVDLFNVNMKGLSIVEKVSLTGILFSMCITEMTTRRLQADQLEEMNRLREAIVSKLLEDEEENEAQSPKH